MSDEAGHVVLMINGEQRSFTPESRTLLVQLLRDGCGLTGTKIGCDTGQCGACTVLVGGRAMKSCMLLAIRLDGASITTVEGLSSVGESLAAAVVRRAPWTAMRILHARHDPGGGGPAVTGLPSG